MPGVARRLASFVYEGVLLFGVVMVVGLIYGLLTDQRHALQGSMGLRAVLFAVLGVYFVHFWSRQGQTLAMKTWHLRLVTPQGRFPTPLRALARYLLAWLWFVPALAVIDRAGIRGGWPVTAILATGILAYAGLAWLRQDRQFLHDVLSGTRLVHWRPAERT